MHSKNVLELRLVIYILKYILYFSIFGLPDTVWKKFTWKITQKFDKWINFKIFPTEVEATQAITFGEEENTRRVYLSGKILSFKHKANILYWHWIFRGFTESLLFCGFDNYLHYLRINSIFKAKKSWFD